MRLLTQPSFQAVWCLGLLWCIATEVYLQQIKPHRSEFHDLLLFVISNILHSEAVMIPMHPFPGLNIVPLVALVQAVGWVVSTAYISIKKYSSLLLLKVSKPLMKDFTKGTNVTWQGIWRQVICYTFLEAWIGKS